jgi:cytochrome c551/c552
VTRVLAALACTVALAGCGGDSGEHGGEDGENTRTAAGTPAPEVTESAGAAPDAAALPSAPGTEKGRRLVLASGCLACHKVGVAGEDGPGPVLTKVGSRLDDAEIRRNLVSPTPPMPPYRMLPKADLDALVSYLATLR